MGGQDQRCGERAGKVMEMESRKRRPGGGLDVGDAGPDGWAGWGRGKMTSLGSQALGSWGDAGARSTSKRVGPLAAGTAPPFPAQLGSAL